MPGLGEDEVMPLGVTEALPWTLQLVSTYSAMVRSTYLIVHCGFVRTQVKKQTLGWNQLYIGSVSVELLGRACLPGRTHVTKAFMPSCDVEIGSDANMSPKN